VDLVDICFAWGKRDAKVLEQIVSKEINITGSYRFDIKGFSKSDNFLPFKDTDQNIIFKNGFGLFVTSYGSINHFKFGQDYIAHLKQSGTIQTDKTAKLLFEFQQKKQTSFQNGLAFLKRFKNSDIPLVVRVHPSEDPAPYLACKADNSNIHLTNDDSILYWLDKAEYFIHDYCTTVVEGNILGTSGFYFDRPLSEIENPVFYTCSHPIHENVNSDDLIGHKPKKMFSEIPDFTNNLANINSKNASEKIAEKILELATGRKTRAPSLVAVHALMSMRSMIDYFSQNTAYIQNRYSNLRLSNLEKNFINSLENIKSTRINAISNSLFLVQK